ncbi:MAG: hypothetical protein ACYC63_10525 [Armatimonadota bacterium]
MADVTGRNTARRYTIWGLINLLTGGPILGLLAAYDAAVDGGLSLSYPIFDTHSWIVLMGWCVPVTFALVFWLLPILKDLPQRYSSVYNICLTLLVVPTLGLGTYLVMAHLGQNSLFILPVAWACFLSAGILYTLIVWRVCARTLRPTASDLGLTAGAIWLVVILILRLIMALGAVATGRHDFLASSEPAIRLAMLFGFLGNTGLALASAIGPEFLMTRHSRPSVVTSFRFYNTLVALWAGGALYLLPLPFGLGRLLLAFVGFVLAYAVVRLLIELRVLELLAVKANSRRRRLTRTALGTAGLLLLLAVIVVALIGLWIGATVSHAPPELVALPMHLIGMGFFSCIVIGLFVPLLGNQSLTGIKFPLAYGAFVLTLLWLLGRIGITIIVMTTGEPVWYERYWLGMIAGGGALCLALWLLLAMLSVRPAAATTPASPPPPAG